MPLLLLCLIAAAGPGHRAKAERAEALGRMAEAAREYEAAWDEEQAAELLYRLGIVRRKLKEYAKAREALRAYLRVAPQGGLREEVERQLAKIEVLIEADKENYRDPPRKRRRAAPAETAPPPVVSAPVAPPPAVAAPQVAAAPPAATPLIADPPAPARAPVQAAAPSMAAPPAAAPLTAAPPAAVEPVVAPRRSRAAPWLFGASGVALAAGAVLWWDGARVSRDLDARFASGDLTAGDRPLFGRARGESIAGRALVLAGLGLSAAAVWLW